MIRTIFYDITELAKLDKRTGIQRVTRAILNVLESFPPKGWKVIPVSGNESGDFYKVITNSKNNNYVLTDEKIPVPNSGDVFLSVDLVYNITQNLRETLSNYKKKDVGVFVVVYDLIPIRYPEWFEGTNQWFEGNDYLKLFNYWFESSLEFSDGLICISETVAKDVQNWINEQNEITNKPKLSFFHLGSDIVGSVPSKGITKAEKTLLDILKANETFLMVGTIEPRKGHKYALDAFDELWQDKNINLVIVGKKGWHVDDLVSRIESHPQFGKKLFWFNGISDELLIDVYQSSTALLALSEAEGFGLPLIEAKYYNLPVIARDIPIFREVCENNATYLKACSPIELALTIKNWDAANNKRLSNHSKTRILTWQQSTIQLFSVIGKMKNIEFHWDEKNE